MADEKKPSAAAQLMSRHGEKIALSLSAAALLAYLVLGVAMAGKDKGADDLQVQIKRINTEKEADHSSDAAMKAPESKDWHNEATLPWKEIKKATGANDWSASIATRYVEKPFDPKIDPIRPVKVPTIAWGSAEVSLDNVLVKWNVNDFTPAEQKAESKTTDFLKISHVTIERETNGSGKWEMLADNVPANVTSYKDQNIDPKTKYKYRITSHVEKDPKGRAEAKGMTVASPGPVETQGIWKLSFSNAMKGQVWITIEKFDKAYGGKVPIRRITHAGEQIGWWPERGSPEPVSKHFVSLPGGKQVEVDFNCGMTLKSVEPVKLPIEVKRCKPKFGPGGAKIGCEQQVEKRSLDTSEIIYTDDEGEKKVYVPAPSTMDQLCDEHGGKKPILSLPPDKTPEQVKAETAQAAAQKREKEAEQLYKDAEKAEASNPKTAIQKYEKLLKEYATTDLVSKDKKAQIESKLARLKQ